jgi:hypothetical protein
MYGSHIETPSVTHPLKVYTGIPKLLFGYRKHTDQPADEAFDDQQSGGKNPKTVSM